MNAPDTLRGRHQESLQAIGAWLDIRGFQDIRIVESDGELVVEAAGAQGQPAVIERIRLDSEFTGR